MTRCKTFCRTLGFAFLVLLACTQQVSALTVNTLVDEQDGSVTDGDVSLRDAIKAAAPGESVHIGVAGTIRLTRGQQSHQADCRSWVGSNDDRDRWQR